MTDCSRFLPVTASINSFDYERFFLEDELQEIGKYFRYLYFEVIT